MSSLFDIIIKQPLSEPLVRGLLFTTFTLHMIFVLFALGTGILALFYFIAAWWDGKLEDVRWDKEILRVFLAHKSLAVVLGVAALLAIQVGFTFPFFTAISIHAEFWMYLVIFFIIAFLFLDFPGAANLHASLPAFGPRYNRAHGALGHTGNIRRRSGDQRKIWTSGLPSRKTAIN